MSTSLPQRERCLQEGCQSGPCPHKHPASGNQADRKPPWGGLEWEAVFIDPAFGKGGRPEGGWTCSRAEHSLTVPLQPPAPLPLPVTSPPHSETLLSRLQVPTLPTSTSSLSSSVCPFPAPGEEACERLHCCVQQCGRGFPSLLARVQQDTAWFPGVRGCVPPSGERP